jgi:hypothetical protein
MFNLSKPKMKSITMIKIIYPIVLLIHVLIGIIYFTKFEISYKIVKVSPELVEVRSLTQNEVKALDKAYIIRATISTIFICSSVLVALFSFFLLKYNLFTPVLLLKISFGLSLLSALVLIVANGINFIPGPPPQ